MKKVKLVLLTFVLICGTTLSSRTEASQRVPKPIVYTFYNALTEVWIDYNPGNNTISDVRYMNPPYETQATTWDSSTAVVTEVSATEIYIQYFEVMLDDEWGIVDGTFIRVD